MSIVVGHGPDRAGLQQCSKAGAVALTLAGARRRDDEIGAVGSDGRDAHRLPCGGDVGDAGGVGAQQPEVHVTRVLRRAWDQPPPAEVSKTPAARHRACRQSPHDRVGEAVAVRVQGHAAQRVLVVVCEGVKALIVAK